MNKIRLALLIRPGGRFFSDAAGANDIRGRLLSEVKTAMKNKDTFTSTTLRSVLSDVYAADKTSPPKISSSAITTIIRKAALRRTDSAAQFINASRPDLAEKEKREADILSTFLPPLLSESEIDRVLRDVLAEHKPEGDPRKALGKVLKAFYSKVDKSTVDAGLVKHRAESLIRNPT
jgi:uncharacterized protein YqeY